MVSTIIPVFARRPLVGYTWVALATVATGVHRLRRVGAPHVRHRAAAARAVVLLRREPRDHDPERRPVLRLDRDDVDGPAGARRRRCCSSLGFLVIVPARRLTGVMVAVVPFDWQVTDSYFVVAHFHYVLIGGARVPDLRGDLLLAAEDDRPDARRAARRRRASGSMFVGFNLDVLPDAHPRAARDAAARLHVPRRASAGTRSTCSSTIGAFVFARRDPARRRRTSSGAVGAARAPAPIRGAATRSSGRRPRRRRSTTSPSIPVVHSARPALGRRATAREDARRVERGELTLADGHETTGDDWLDAELDEMLEMPAESPWPLVLALALAWFFVAAR